MKNFICLLFVILVLMGCRKECKTRYTRVNNDIKSSFNFKSGSFWIFKDSVSGVVDSFYIYNERIFNNLDYNEYRELCASDEELEFKMKRSRDSFWFLEFSFKTNYMYVDFADQKNELISIVGLCFIEDEQHFKHKNNGITHLSSKKVNDAYSGFYLSTNFWDLQAIDSFASDNNTISHSRYLYNDTIGFVKMKIYLDNGKEKIDQVWELQRWHIVK